MALTQKQLVNAALYYTLPQTPADIAQWAGVPGPSARRVLQELVAAKEAKFVKRGYNGRAGYVRVP